jgi:hypothetical protein
MSPDEARFFKLHIIDGCLPAAEGLADSTAHLRHLIEKLSPSETELSDFRDCSYQQIEAIRGWAKAIREHQNLDLIDGKSKMKKITRSEAQTHPELLKLVADLEVLSERVKKVLLEERKRLRYPVVQAADVNFVSRIEPSLDSQLKELDRLAKLVEKSIQSYMVP